MTDTVKSDARVDEQAQADTSTQEPGGPLAAGDGEVTVEVVHEAGEPQGTDVPRPLKIVLTLQPHEDRPQVLVAVAREGCDPYFRALDLASLASVLAQVPSVVAEAEAHWQTQPLYPRIPTPTRSATISASRGSASRSSPPQKARGNAAPGPAATPSGSSSDQEPPTGELSERTDESPGEPAAAETEARPASRRGVSPQLPLFS